MESLILSCKETAYYGVPKTDVLLLSNLRACNLMMICCDENIRGYRLRQVVFRWISVQFGCNYFDIFERFSSISKQRYFLNFINREIQLFIFSRAYSK